MKKSLIRNLAIAGVVSLTGGAFASSHMDAPLITLDPAANTTDVYAFVSSIGGQKYLVTALGVYPHQEPGVGPNKYNFDDNVVYGINIATGPNVAAGTRTLTYEFRFNTTYRNQNTILQSYLGVINSVGDANQNLIQTYSVRKFDFNDNSNVLLGTGTVPPNNQGVATPLYNQGNDGNNPAKPGVILGGMLDDYTAQAVTTFPDGTIVFAGQRDDGFYGDINSIFDLLSLRSTANGTDPNTGVDSQGGFNIHMMAIAIPVNQLGGDQQIVGVWGTTSRPTFNIVTNTTSDRDRKVSKSPNGRRTRINVVRTNTTTQTVVPTFVQVARQGNPLFNEALVAIADKDLYSRTTPQVDATTFRDYALNPELAALINAIVFGGSGPAVETNRTDIAGIYIPDTIKVDLSTPPARLAGSGNAIGAVPGDTNPDDAGFSNQSIFGGDTLPSAIQDPFANGGNIPGGWPNGRRFGDDVVDIAVTALISDLRDPNNLIINSAAGIDGVNRNDATYSKVFPYEATPQNGRNHTHPSASNPAP